MIFKEQNIINKKLINWKLKNNSNGKSNKIEVIICKKNK